MNFFQCILCGVLTVVVLYIVFRIQAIAWMHTIDRYLNNKYNNLKTKSNEQTKSK